jgi:NADP-dependent 3-hydroxy acid dehydrogenase YdfG
MKGGGRVLTAVVTGGASGIGRALAEVLHTQGADLVLADADTAALDAAAMKLGATPVTVDVADQVAMCALAAQFPQARLICLNAGVSSSGRCNTSLIGGQ